MAGAWNGKSILKKQYGKVILMNDKEAIREFITQKYGSIAVQGGEDCCGGGGGWDTGTAKPGEASLKLGYSPEDLASVPQGANLDLGCGNPVSLAALKEGETIVDLGCGPGLDCFLARIQVGETGRVIGIDMTPDMLALARKNARESGYDNVEFRMGEIEHLPVADCTVDAVISNCVINLSSDKQQVYNEIYRTLKPGGRLAISDVLAIAPLPAEITQDLDLISCWIGGAEYPEDIHRMLQNAGFKEITLTPKENSAEIVSQWAPEQRAENYVASYLIQAVK